MGVGHGHGHGGGAAGSGSAGHAGGRHRWRLGASFGLISAFFVVELVVGVVSGSLALISDAGHMAADVVTLGAALVATKIATRADSTGRRTYGSYRAEVFASGLAVLMMLGVAVYVVVEAIGRAGSEPDVETGPMLGVGFLGLVVNLVAMALLRGGSQDSLNVKGAYVEVVADTAGSVGVMVAGGLILATGDGVWDTVVAFLIGAFVAVRAVLLGREVLAVLGQHVPAGVEIDTVAGALGGIDGVCDVHDLHAWTLTSGMHVATAHLVLDEGADGAGVLRQGQLLLREQFQIEHATLQIEGHRSAACDAVTW
ncbi:cation diffusion facilitator family transporter [Nocardioides daeguensis]|uniref:Cation diffusion facilitator family transporter n=1 Tax=Nocardioides daeguensis TaxID=908359 RepID=A0ABP6WGN0_9ACTN|nr:cation diffusion facilitator family transporter [Nocardioides daeguensis]MBV6728029.1 cation diffusion facilitator family transporter [Nocardioides daeguensis]MCR1774103.1 cation diffusion facilitator family transporter [Nocardioides daeguensis]